MGWDVLQLGHATRADSAEGLSGKCLVRANHIDRCIRLALCAPIETFHACAMDPLLVLLFRRKGGSSSRQLCGVESQFAAIAPPIAADHPGNSRAVLSCWNCVF